MTETAPHPLDRAIRLARSDDGSLTGRTDPAYDHAVGPFGGVTAATLLNAALTHPSRIGDPIALTVNYAGPIADGGFRIDAGLVRTNRSTQHWSMTLTQGDEVAATASAVFAVRRETWAATEAAFPKAPPAAQVPRLQLPRATAWFGSYDLRIVRGMPLDASRPEAERDGEEAEPRHTVRNGGPCREQHRIGGRHRIAVHRGKPGA